MIKPDFYFEWEEAYGCVLNRRYYLINYNPYPVIVDVTWRVPGTIDREHKEFTVRGNVRHENFKDGVDLGYEEYSLPGSTCHDKDFMVGGFRKQQYATSEQSAIEVASEAFPRLLARKQLEIARLENEFKNIAVADDSTSEEYLPVSSKSGKEKIIPGPMVTILSDSAPRVEVKQQVEADCQAICDSGDTLRCPIRGFPPDQEKLISLRDKLRVPISSSKYSAADIYQIFGLAKTSCERSDIQVVKDKVFNSGQYCAFPMLLKATDTTPALSIHFPETLKGERISGQEAGGIAFNSGVSMPSLHFADSSLDTNYGGSITDAMASEKGVYYQTTGTCIFIGVKK
jgi:hypothetical protein